MIPMLFLGLALQSSADGAAPAHDRSRPVKAVLRNGPWIRSVDYPASALKESRAGITHFRLDIDEKGGILGCTVIGPSGWPDLDAKGCRLVVARGRFLPARDAAGTAIRSTYSDSIVWLPQEQAAISRASWSRTASFESDEKGALVGCTLEDKGTITSGFFALCEVPFTTAQQQARGSGTPLASRRFIRRIAQSAGGVSVGSFVPPAGAVEVEMAAMHYTVTAEGRAHGCVLRHSFRGKPMKPKACVAGPFEAMPIGSQEVEMDWSMSTWELPSDPNAPRAR